MSKEISAEEQRENLKLINNGYVLETNRGVKAFKLFGKVYSTNLRRVAKGGAPYKFNDPSWILTHKCIVYKLKAVVMREAKAFRMQ